MPAEQRPVSLRANPCDTLPVDSPFVHVRGKHPFSFYEPVPRRDARDRDHALLDQFLLASLQGEIALRERDFFLAWVAVHGDEVACVAREHVILDLALAPATQSYHFADLGKMVLIRGFRRFG